MIQLCPAIDGCDASLGKNWNFFEFVTAYLQQITASLNEPLQRPNNWSVNKCQVYYILRRYDASLFLQLDATNTYFHLTKVFNILVE